MIPLVRQTLLNVSGVPDHLSFLKYSTPDSGRSLTDKLVLMGFQPSAALPSVVIKTVRHYAAKQNIVRGFDNLKCLHALTKGSAFEGLFAKPLHLYDDGECVFSAETACTGERVRLTHESLERLVKQFSEFQAHAAELPLRGLHELSILILRDCGVSSEGKGELLRFFDSLPPSSLKLPRVLQLGDLTEDNVLMSDESFQIVDYDRVGEIDLPGFDLMGLLYRFDTKDVRRLCEKYLPAYLEKIGAEGRGLDRLMFLYYVAERTVRKPYRQGVSAEDIISGFSKLFQRSRPFIVQTDPSSSA